MNRRAFLCGLTLGTLVAPLALEAQQAGKAPRIGVLAGATAATYAYRFDSFRQGLRELGYVDGQNVAIEYRYADGKLEASSCQQPPRSGPLARSDGPVGVLGCDDEWDAPTPTVFELVLSSPQVHSRQKRR